VQVRNFGLKSGGTNSEGERGALGTQDERGREVKETSSSPSNSGIRESVVSSFIGIRNRVPAELRFIVI